MNEKILRFFPLLLDLKNMIWIMDIFEILINLRICAMIFQRYFFFKLVAEISFVDGNFFHRIDAWLDKPFCNFFFEIWIVGGANYRVSRNFTRWLNSYYSPIDLFFPLNKIWLYVQKNAENSAKKSQVFLRGKFSWLS